MARLTNGGLYTKRPKMGTWSTLQEALVARFETLNKEKIALDKLAKWKQLKDVATFNDDFSA